MSAKQLEWERGTKLILFGAVTFALVVITAILYFWERIKGAITGDPLDGFTRPDANILVSLACSNFPNMPNSVRCKHAMATGLGIGKERLCSARLDAENFAFRIIRGMHDEMGRLQVFDKPHIKPHRNEAMSVFDRWEYFEAESKKTFEYANKFDASTSITMAAATEVGRLLGSVAEDLADWAKTSGQTAQQSQHKINIARRNANSEKLNDAIQMVTDLVSEIKEIERYCQNHLLSAVFGT